ncbi:phosphoribosylamine--glycine ligase [Brachybacterium saurashtrense]|uniref:Phosphoribosylamine--glycine ligase n=1 Tax=Brachybacterium saurashtrense TaxID=556288 RepID=A0A345YPA2_9MICO|nr:phosphoribosylamine--glycine ligase [Brachybacterium saurashtrense]AXK45754.1 phosphoribosylamine--glycine ligase [Brachybacterium saurashtrense]RRR24772.1 phosphoribosylamine--glycine ligase [Brachybacterium saurashtrense]
MKILVLGSGGREHAITRRLAADRPAPELHVAPGNPGIAQLATCHDVSVADLDGQVRLAEELRPDLVVIGPEAPLVAGAADRLRAAGFDVFGPSAEAARLEGSKSWAKEIMAAAGVPTAASVTVTDPAELAAGLDRVNPLGDVPFVVKADGLAAGKGVVVTEDRAAAVAHAESVLEAGGQVVLEEYLDGPEVSLFCVSDGTRVVPLAPAQDFKRALDDDQGPNTGGMGAYSPLPWAPEGLVEDVVETVARPTIAELADRGIPFVGILYCGLALTSRGLRVVEFNARFGDPETQVVLERLDTPFAPLLRAAARGELAEKSDGSALRWSEDAVVTVVVASAGYPASARTGDPLTGIEACEERGAHVIHAGTAEVDGALVSAGGRVLSVVARGTDLEQARTRALEAAEQIVLEGSQHRTDIARRAAADARAAAEEAHQ